MRRCPLGRNYRIILTQPRILRRVCFKQSISSYSQNSISNNLVKRYPYRFWNAHGISLIDDLVKGTIDAFEGGNRGKAVLFEEEKKCCFINCTMYRVTTTEKLYELGIDSASIVFYRSSPQ